MPSCKDQKKKVFVQIAISAILTAAGTAAYADRLPGTPGAVPTVPVPTAPATPPANTAPANGISVPGRPFGLKAVPVTASMVDVQWTAGSNDENGFEVEESSDGGVSWTSAGKTIAGTTEMPSEHLKPATVYTFRVHAFNGGGVSDSSDPVTVATLGQGTGLTGEYFHRWPVKDGPIKVTKMFVRHDPYINFNWDDGMDAGGTQTEAKVHDFLIVWTGQVTPLYSGDYTFYTMSDDGARLWVNGQKLIDNWTEHAPTEDKGTIRLEAGKKYDIRVGYYENDSGGASISLSWSSDQQEKQVIPQSQLYPLTAKELEDQSPSAKTAKQGAK
jgi:hypothetical protein